MIFISSKKQTVWQLTLGSHTFFGPNSKLSKSNLEKPWLKITWKTHTPPHIPWTLWRHKWSCAFGPDWCRQQSPWKFFWSVVVQSFIPKSFTFFLLGGLLIRLSNTEPKHNLWSSNVVHLLSSFNVDQSRDVPCCDPWRIGLGCSGIFPIPIMGPKTPWAPSFQPERKAMNHGICVPHPIPAAASIIPGIPPRVFGNWGGHMGTSCPGGKGHNQLE